MKALYVLRLAYLQFLQLTKLSLISRTTYGTQRWHFKTRLLVSKLPLLMLSYADFFRITDTFSTTTYGLLLTRPYLYLSTPADFARTLQDNVRLQTGMEIFRSRLQSSLWNTCLAMARDLRMLNDCPWMFSVISSVLHRVLLHPANTLEIVSLK